MSVFDSLLIVTFVWWSLYLDQYRTHLLVIWLTVCVLLNYLVVPKGLAW